MEVKERVTERSGGGVRIHAGSEARREGDAGRQGGSKERPGEEQGGRRKGGNEGAATEARREACRKEDRKGCRQGGRQGVSVADRQGGNKVKQR